MNVVSIVIIVLLAVFSIVGLIVGLCKGFSHVKSWGVEYLLASLLGTVQSQSPRDTSCYSPPPTDPLQRKKLRFRELWWHFQLSELN